MGLLSGIFGKKQDKPALPAEEESKAETAGEQEREDETPDFRKLIWMNLLFREKPQRPAPEKFTKLLGEKLQSDIDTVTAQEDGLYSFAVRALPVTYQDGQKLPAQVLASPPTPFKQETIDDFMRSQLWDVEDGSAFLESCTHCIMLSDFMASGLPYKERARLLTAWVEAALELLPGCVGVWVPSAGKLLTREQVLNNPLKGDSRFLWFGVNVRLFNISNGQEGEKVMDTIGLYALGLPDVQLHFHGLDPNAVSNYLYNVGQYLYDNDVPIKPGETVDGVNAQGNIDQGIQWVCQYEQSLIQPQRPVMDICPGQFAAGRRQGGSENKKNKK